MERPEALVKSQQGIKETSEAMDAIVAVVVPVKKALKDGKLNAADVPHALELLGSHKVILDGILGVDKIIPEAKDLSTEELAVIGAKALSAIKQIREA